MALCSPLLTVTLADVASTQAEPSGLRVHLALSSTHSADGAGESAVAGPPGPPGGGGGVGGGSWLQNASGSGLGGGLLVTAQPPCTLAGGFPPSLALSSRFGLNVLTFKTANESPERYCGASRGVKCCGESEDGPASAKSWNSSVFILLELPNALTFSFLWGEIYLS